MLRNNSKQSGGQQHGKTVHNSTADNSEQCHVYSRRIRLNTNLLGLGTGYAYGRTIDKWTDMLWLKQQLYDSDRKRRLTFPNCSKYDLTSSTVVDALSPPTNIFFVFVTNCTNINRTARTLPRPSLEVAPSALRTIFVFLPVTLNYD